MLHEVIFFVIHVGIMFKMSFHLLLKMDDTSQLDTLLYIYIYIVHICTVSL